MFLRTGALDSEIGGAALLAGSLDLLGRPQIGLGKFHVLFGAGNLTFVTLLKSFVHTLIIASADFARQPRDSRRKAAAEAAASKQPTL